MLFWVRGVEKGKYRILNKQYSEGEYKTLRSKIIEGLKRENLYGLFMPPSLAPFAYNETIAQDYLPLTKEQALAQGFRWQHDIPATKGKETMQPSQIPDQIKDVSDGIVKEVLACVTCGRNYRIIKLELLLYRTMQVPIPRQCFSCGYRDRVNRRGPLTLYDRACNRCNKPIQTNFAPQRPEIVYCEQCYLQEAT